MAVILEKNKINIQDLTVTGKRDIYNKNPESIYAFNINEDKIKIPFAYGIQKGGKVRQHKNNTVKFIGNLLERQIEDMKKAKDKLLKDNYVFLSLYCGYGKTICSLYLAGLIGKNVLIITDRQLITSGWLTAIKKFTNCEPVIIRGKSDLTDVKIGIVGIDTLRNIPEEKLLNFATVIVDEAIGYCTQIRSDCFLKLQPEYLIGLSADIERKDGLHKILELYFGPSDSYLRKISEKKFIVYKFNTSFKPDVKYMPYTGQLDWNVVLDSICNNKERNKMIAEMAILNAGKKIIILCKRKQQATSIYEILLSRGVSSQLLIGNSKSYENCDVLVSTYSKAGKGFDDENCCKDFDGRRLDLLIFASDIGTLPEQYIGRTFRSHKPSAYYIVDDFSSFRKHWSKFLLPWFVSRNGDIVEEWL